MYNEFIYTMHLGLYVNNIYFVCVCVHNKS